MILCAFFEAGITSKSAYSAAYLTASSLVALISPTNITTSKGSFLVAHLTSRFVGPGWAGWNSFPFVIKYPRLDYLRLFKTQMLQLQFSIVSCPPKCFSINFFSAWISASFANVFDFFKCPFPPASICVAIAPFSRGLYPDYPDGNCDNILWF